MGFFSFTKPRSRLPEQIRFDPEVARREVPDKLVARGLFTTREEASRALEIVISMAEEEKVEGDEKK